MVMVIDEVEQRYGPGDWYHVPARVEHSAYCDVGSEEVEFWFNVAEQ